MISKILYNQYKLVRAVNFKISFKNDPYHILGVS